LIVALLTAVAAGIGAAALLGTREPLALRSGTALPEPRPIGDFALIDQHGVAFGPAAFEDRWSLVFTGFTHCPDICPATLALLAALRKRLPDENLQLVFVSVDPERDTPERMAAYLAHFGADLKGATGTRAQVEDFTGRLGLAQVRNPGVAGEYTVDHSAALVLIDPRARVAGYFMPPHDIGTLAADLASIHGRQP
jgi:protein SCO1/2